MKVVVLTEDERVALAEWVEQVVEFHARGEDTEAWWVALLRKLS